MKQRSPAHFFKILGCVLSGPGDLPGFNSLRILLTFCEKCRRLRTLSLITWSNDGKLSKLSAVKTEDKNWFMHAARCHNPALWQLDHLILHAWTACNSKNACVRCCCTYRQPIYRGGPFCRRALLHFFFNKLLAFFKWATTHHYYYSWLFCKIAFFVQV